MVGKGNLAIFESSNIFETGMVTPIKIVVHAQYIDLYLHEFFEPQYKLLLNHSLCYSISFDIVSLQLVLNL